MNDAYLAVRKCNPKTNKTVSSLRRSFLVEQTGKNIFLKVAFKVD
jgi:hypothetical protein